MQTSLAPPEALAWDYQGLRVRRKPPSPIGCRVIIKATSYKAELHPNLRDLKPLNPSYLALVLGNTPDLEASVGTSIRGKWTKPPGLSLKM
jgi:hypothetical protein